MKAEVRPLPGADCVIRGWHAPRIPHRSQLGTQQFSCLTRP